MENSIRTALNVIVKKLLKVKMKLDIVTCNNKTKKNTSETEYIKKI